MITQAFVLGVFGFLSCAAFASDDKQDCRQEEGRIGDDKRDCKQENRGEGDEAEDDEDDKEDGADA